ncbi:hypothetical protein GCM10011324_22920 [Allosediminivita pacifica]|nr:hypothetical protein GCM10011324_22920 [Allosediminivita pacifica]
MHETIRVKEAASCEPIETTRERGFFEVPCAATYEVGDSWMPKRVRFAGLEFIDVLEKDTSVNTKVLADSVKHIRAGKALAREIPVILCPVDAQVTA